MRCCANLRALHVVVLVFFIVHGVLEPLSALVPSVIGYVWPKIYYWLFGDEERGSVALAYAFRNFSCLNAFAGTVLARVVSWPLLTKGYYTDQEFEVVTFILWMLLLVGDVPYSFASVWAKLQDPSLSWRIWLPAALVRKFGGVRPNQAKPDQARPSEAKPSETTPLLPV
jgi:hypothetical protein